jgi:hypothetical protein
MPNALLFAAEFKRLGFRFQVSGFRLTLTAEAGAVAERKVELHLANLNLKLETFAFLLLPLLSSAFDYS